MKKRVNVDSDDGTDAPSTAQMDALLERFSHGDRSRLEGGTEKIRRGRSDEDNEGGGSRRNRREGRRPPISTPWVRDPEPEPHPAIAPSAPVQERRSITPERKDTMTTDQTQPRRERTTGEPFFQALELARQINTRQPQSEQPEIYAELMATLKQLDYGQKRNLTNRVRDEVLQDRCPTQGLFPVAREAGIFPVAPNTAAVKTAMRENDLSCVDLVKAGLGEMKVNPRVGRAFFTGRVRFEDIEAAIPLLRENGKTKAADSLRGYLDKQELRQLGREAERDFRAKQATTQASSHVEATETPAPAAEADETAAVVEATETPVEEPVTAVATVTAADATDEPKPKAKRTRKPKAAEEATS